MKNELEDEDDELDDVELLDDDEQDDDEQDDELDDDEQDDDELDEQVVVDGTPVILADVTLTAGRFLNELTSPVKRSVTPDEESVELLSSITSLLTSNAVTPVLDAGLNT